MALEHWDFAEQHMPAVRRILATLPVAYFLDINTADPKHDMEQATDLYFELRGGCLAVRVRRNEYLRSALKYNNNFDWSVRAVNGEHRTELDKLRAGFGDWYLYAYSSNDVDSIARWWLLNLHRIREQGILNVSVIHAENGLRLDDCSGLWKGPYPNDDHKTMGIYYSLARLDDLGCVIAKGADMNQDVQLAMWFGNQGNPATANAPGADK